VAAEVLKYSVNADLTPGETPWTDEAAGTLATADQLQAEQQWRPALDLYHKALVLSPNPPGFQRYVIYNNLGWSLFHLNRWSDAETHYQIALQAVPSQPPTDHAYINLATLYKAQGKTKSTIKAYRSAVQLTKQLPTWAQLGHALMTEFRVDEAVSSLQEGLAFRGDGDPGAQECHWYLGMLNMWRRRWSTASNHFIKSLDLGLPEDASGCRGGRWSVAEGWASNQLITVQPLPISEVVEALRAVSLRTPLRDAEVTDSASAPGEGSADERERATLELTKKATASFKEPHSGETYADVPVGGEGSRGGGGSATTEAPYKLVEIRNVYVEGRRLTSLFHSTPECRYYVGEATASAVLASDFGVIDREQNASYDRAHRYTVHTHVVSQTTFAVFDARGAFESDTYNAQVSLLTRLIVLLQVILLPRRPLTPAVDYSHATLFLPSTLARYLSRLRAPR